jgi:hypothetical protein
VSGSDAGRRPHALGDRVVEPRLHADEVGEHCVEGNMTCHYIICHGI